MAPENPSTIARLGGLLAVTRLVRSEQELPVVLEAVAGTISRALGFATVAINLYRPAWDDFLVTTVHGSERARVALLGDERDWSTLAPLLDDRFLRRGAYLIPSGEYDWENGAVRSYVPDLEPSDDPDAWTAEDALMVPMRHTDGHLLGIISVDEPESGRRPSAEELDVLVAVADHAALAVQSAQEAAVAARYRASLEQLLQVSSELADATTIGDMLRAVCAGIRDALGFQNVSVDLVDARTGRLDVQAAVGWDLDGDAMTTPISLADMMPLLDPQFEREGCFLVPSDEALARVPHDKVVYVSRMNGRGPWAWNEHWLVVPLYDGAGGVIGLIWVDEPDDRLLPSAERLQALRVFANQATTAISAAAQFQELRFLADHDPLTRLLNRRAFIRRLESEVHRCTRYGRSFGLVVCDLDGFKLLNDRHGHPAGDLALQEVARVLTASLRRPDDAFRIGGDEFALLLAEATNDGALEVVERVAESLRASEVRASFGVAVFPRDGSDPEQLFRAADKALYVAKRSGATCHFAA